MVEADRRIPKPTRIAIAALGAVLALAFLLAFLAGARSQAAPLRNAGTGADPAIEAITVTSDLPISDTYPGDGITKTVYFNNAVPGIITLTFEISGTPTLTLTAGAAFGDPAQILTSSNASWSPVVTYGVETGGGDYAGVAYTAINTDGVQTSIAITYVRDITGPTVSILAPPAGYFSGTTLFITGTAQDNSGGAGMRRVQITTGTAWMTTTGVATWAYTWTLPITDGFVYTILARADDLLGTWGVAATRVITVDNVPPTGTIVFTPSLPVCQWVSTNTLNVQWDGFTDGGGIAGYQYFISDTAPLTLPLAGGTFTTVTGVTETLDEREWYFGVAARDVAGNWSTTHYTGPFHVDVTSPTAVISIPTPGTVLTTELSSITITGAAWDATSGITQVQVTTGTAWNVAVGANTWAYTWTLPSADNAAYILQARTTDRAGNQCLSASVPVTVDTVSPTATAPVDAGIWAISSTLVFTWTPSTDGAGIIGYAVLITNSDGVTVAENVFVPATPHIPSYTLSNVIEGTTYCARVRARDGNGNCGGYGPLSDGITPDLTPPDVRYSIPPIIPVSSDGLYAVGATVYYTNASSSDRYFLIQGTATDTLSGAGAAYATAALGTSTPSNSGTWEEWAFMYRVPSGATTSGRITATLSDAAGQTAAQVFTYTHDPLAPTGAITIQGGIDYVSTSTVTLDLFASDNLTGCGVEQMCVSDEPLCSAWENYTTTNKSWNLDAGDGWKTIYVRYRDYLDNTTNFYTDSVLLDTIAPVVTVTAPTYTTATTFIVSWETTDPTPTSGLVPSYTVEYRQDKAEWNWLTATTQPSVSFSGAQAGCTYDFRVRAPDQAGNSGCGEASTRVGSFSIYLPLVMRNYPPSPTGSVTIASGAACVYQPSVTLTLSATVEGDDVTEMRLRNEDTAWDDGWETFTTLKAWTLADGISGPRTVYAQFRGSKGGVSDPVSDQIYLAWNGDFEDGWDHWEHGKGSFGGNGSGLDQNVVSFEGSKRARLGNPTYQDGSIPVGYAHVAQEFTVPAGNRRLSLQYRVRSRDTVWGASTQKYFDTLEVSINRPPGQVSNQERDNQGCRNPSRLNPTGSLAISGNGLVFCGGQPPTSSPEEWDSGWRTVTLDLSAFTPGQSITLYVATWSREHTSPAINDRAYYNTYSYVDNITMQGDW